MYESIAVTETGCFLVTSWFRLLKIHELQTTHAQELWGSPEAQHTKKPWNSITENLLTSLHILSSDQLILFRIKKL